MKKKSIGLVLLLVVLLVGGWYVFSRGIKPIGSRVKSAFINLLEEKNGHVKSEIVFKPGKNSQATFQEMKVSTNGDFQKGTNGSLEIETTLDVVGQATGASLSGKGEVVLIGGQMFYRIDELPPIFSDAEKISGKWIEGSSNMIILSDTLRSGILKSLQNQEIFSEIKRVGNEKVDGVGTTHVKAKLSSAGYSSFLAELVKQISGDTSITKEQIEKNVSKLDGLMLDLWIDSSDNLRKINIISNNEDGSTTDVSIYFSKFEGKIKIEAPRDALRLSAPVVSASPVSSINK